MTRDLNGKRIIITGASSGIGSQIARGAAKRGARVALFARSADKLNALAGELQGKAIAVAGDVTIQDDRARLVRTTVEQFGGVDILINNAGVAAFGHFATSTEDIMRKVMEVNFFAPIELIRTAVPELTKGNQPAIVNISSMCGRRGMPAWPEYSAAKSGLCGMTEALRGEMARFEIDVLLIVPGLTKSDFSSHMLRNEGKMKIPFETGMPPEEVAEAVLYAIERNSTETVLGSEAKRILRLNRFFPRILDGLIAKKVKQLYAEG